MLRATKDIMLPTTITGSLPRPSWYTQNLGMRSFLDAMVNNQFREQYVDTVSVYLHEQEVAGLDIVTDGDAHFDSDVGGQSWTNYPPRHMGGFDRNPQPIPAGQGGLAFPPGHILHDYLEVARDAQHQRAGHAGRSAICRHVEGCAAPDQEAGQVRHHRTGARRLRGQDRHYKSLKDRILAVTDALNAELHELADAGCPVIQFEEPQIHLLAVRNIVNDVINPAFSVEVFNRTVKGLRAKTEVWCHTCWGNPSQQRMFKEVQSYKAALEMLNKVDADVITFESVSAGGADLEAFGKIITDKKIAIGVIDHHSLQVERPDEIAEHIRRALKHIPAERLVLSSDCGMGREGMSRRHAYYKIVSLVLGTNIVRKELGPAAGRLPGR